MIKPLVLLLLKTHDKEGKIFALFCTRTHHPKHTGNAVKVLTRSAKLNY